MAAFEEFSAEEFPGKPDDSSSSAPPSWANYTRHISRNKKKLKQGSVTKPRFFFRQGINKKIRIKKRPERDTDDNLHKVQKVMK